MTAKQVKSSIGDQFGKHGATVGILLAMWIALGGQVDQLREDVRRLRDDVTRMMLHEAPAAGNVQAWPKVDTESDSMRSSRTSGEVSRCRGSTPLQASPKAFAAVTSWKAALSSSSSSATMARSSGGYRCELQGDTGDSVTAADARASPKEFKSFRLFAPVPIDTATPPVVSLPSSSPTDGGWTPPPLPWKSDNIRSVSG